MQTCKEKVSGRCFINQTFREAREQRFSEHLGILDLYIGTLSCLSHQNSVTEVLSRAETYRAETYMLLLMTAQVKNTVF